MVDTTDQQVVKEAIVLLVIPTVAVIARFWSRLLTPEHPLGWDDWTCLLALIFNFSTCVVGLIYTFLLLGKDPADVTLSNRTIGFEILFSSYFLFTTGVALVKISALLFYTRVFKTYGNGFKRAVWLAYGLIFLWVLISDILIATTCNPTRKIWLPTIEGKCHSLFAAYLFSGLGDTLLDMYILILPVPFLWSLKMKRERKLLISGAFALGYGSIIISVGRLATILASDSELSMNSIEETGSILVWTLPEIGLGILSICLPNLWRLYNRVRRLGWRSLFSASIRTQDQYSVEKPLPDSEV